MAVKVKIDAAQFADHMKKLAGRFYPAMLRGVEAGALRTIPHLQRRTREAPPASPSGTQGAFNLGLYHAGWRSAPLPNGARVFNVQPYSPIVEYGRRPSPVGRAGIRNLEGWARRKLKLPATEAKAAAWAIAKTLEKRELKAREVMTGDQAGMVELVEREIMHELDAELRRI